ESPRATTFQIVGGAADACGTADIAARRTASRPILRTIPRMLPRVGARNPSRTGAQRSTCSTHPSPRGVGQEPIGRFAMHLIGRLSNPPEHLTRILSLA